MRLRVLRSLLRLGIDNLHASAQDTGMDKNTGTTTTFGTDSKTRQDAMYARLAASEARIAADHARYLLIVGKGAAK